MKLNKLLQLLRDNAKPRAEGDAPAIRLDTSSEADARIYVYDVIDPYWGASAQGLIQALQAAGDRKVHLHVNSPGGDVFEGLAMSAAIAAHPTPIEAHIEGLAASAATGLVLACSSVDMLEGSLFMVHNSWTLAYGNKADLRSTADLLDKVDQGIAATYMRATGCTLEQALAWMDAETWFTAAEAVDAKFVQAVKPASQRDPASASARAAAWNLSAYRNAPKLAPPVVDAAAIAAEADTQLQRNRNRMRALYAPV